MIRKCIWSVVIVLSVTLLAVSIFADTRTRVDRDDAARLRQVDQFNLMGPRAPHSIFSEEEAVAGSASLPSSSNLRPYRPLGAAVSPDLGIGVGESIALTWDDTQVFYPVGRHISHFYNGLTGDDASVDVHFCYEMARDSAARRQEDLPLRQTGYNVYDATTIGGDWPQGGQDVGCTIQGADTIGFGRGGNMVVTPNGLAVFVAYSSFYSPEIPEVGFVRENKLFYQLQQYNCVYSNDPLIGNVTAVDSALYKPFWAQPDLDGNLSAFPSIATQVDGSENLITHIVLGEQQAFNIPPGTEGYATNVDYRVFVYFRKVGEDISGTWSSGIVIDSIERNFYDLVADPNSPNVCIAYSNPSYSGRLLNNGWDKDCYFRESTNYGLSWNPKVNITNYRNDLEGEPHYSMYYEVKALYTTDGNLHILFQQTPASAAPYSDGYNWTDFNQDIAHWDRVSGDYVRVADGTYMNDDALTGSINGLVCSYMSDPSCYTQFFNISECDGKIYAVWNQVHEPNNRYNYIDYPEVLTDCSHSVPSSRYGAANPEIFMSVAKLGTPYLWDQPRNLTNTFTPDCGSPFDPEAEGGPCGAEFKPYVEPYALDETGMDLYWPQNSIVDATPLDDPEYPYDGGWYLNAEYMDDQMPGPAWDTTAGAGRGTNGWYTLNSMKWIRIACVEPIEASLIETFPKYLRFPTWVKAGEAVEFPVVVRNWGNVALNVDSIGTTSGASWLSVDSVPTSLDPFTVDAGLANANTFSIKIDAAGIMQPTWLDGEVWLLSDAADYDSVSITLHVLAADTVEPTVWDTVTTHVNMYHPFLSPYGVCVGLAVGNNGELGWGGGTDGRANLDYTDAATNMDPANAECDTARAGRRWYLLSGTPYTIIADATEGTGARLSQNFNDLNQADSSGFNPTSDKGSIIGGLSAGGEYDSVYTGRFVNRDTSVAMERIVYGPRSATPAEDIINFMIVYTKVYSGDGNPHNHLTFGNAIDWDIPSGNYNHNVAGIIGNFVYLQGTDTVGDTSCANGLNVGRFATEAFGGGYTSAEWALDNCVNSTAHYAARAGEQVIMADSAEWYGVPVTPDANPLAYWNECSVGGLSLVDPMPDTGRDLATYLTYKFDYELSATDTLHYWTVLTTTPMEESEAVGMASLTAQVAYAKIWYTETVRGCEAGCCEGRVGDANGTGEYPDEVTLGDIMLMVDVCFISNDCTKFACVDEADVNQSGGPNPLQSECLNYVTLGDIMTLVDFLFITGPDVAVLNTCL